MCVEMWTKYLSHITSSFYSSILAWKVKLVFPAKNTPKRHRTGEAGLKTLFHSELKPPMRVVHRCTPPPQKAAESEPSSPAPISLMWSAAWRALRTAMMGDVIGTESGDCMITYVEELRVEPDSPMVMLRCRERSEKRKRQLPPPLTLMREMGEMPWTFKRECNGDGRLTVTAEEETRRGHEHCFMEVRTEDERVTMRLRLDPEEDDYCEQCGYPIVVVDDDDDGEMKFNEGFEFEECGLEFEEELAKKVLKETEQCGDLRECVSLTYYGPGALLHLYHSDSLPDIDLGRPASAPIGPILTVSF